MRLQGKSALITGASRNIGRSIALAAASPAGTIGPAGKPRIPVHSATSAAIARPNAGTALSTTQLNATVTGVTGTFAYTPAEGTILDAGTQTLSVTFTPANANYASSTKTVSLTVTPARGRTHRLSRTPPGSMPSWE